MIYKMYSPLTMKDLIFYFLKMLEGLPPQAMEVFTSLTEEEEGVQVVEKEADRP